MSRNTRRLKLLALNCRGDINIVVAALILPILILVGLSAFDLIRVMVNKQQLYGALENGYDHLLTGLGGAGLAHKLHGRDRCAVAPNEISTIPAFDTGCNLPCELSVPPTCTGSGTLNWAGTPDAGDAAIASIEEDVSNSFGVFDMGQLADKDLTVVIAAYDLVVNAEQGATAESSQTVVRRVLLDRSDAGPYRDHVNTDALIEAKFVTPANIKAGSIYGYFGANTPNATHMTVVVIWAAYRVEHYFSFPAWLRLGIDPVDKDSEELIVDPTALAASRKRETYISASMIRVLPNNIRLDL